MPYVRGKPNITALGAPMRMAKNSGFFTPTLADYALLPTWTHHTIVIDKYVLVIILRYLSKESYSCRCRHIFFVKNSVELLPVLFALLMEKRCTSFGVKSYLI